ncbi:MAG: ACP S-malonyltransferase [Candidatus Omnitrophica bacterium]|nr:ACP S-malonyltransferase [Candidatus Omnitrophota bacterium]
MGILPDKMVKTGFLFPGQGIQYVGMGKDFYDSYPAAREIFDRADKVLNFPLSKLCFQGPEEELTKTSVAQPAIFTASLAALSVLKVLLPGLRPAAACGLSLGEFTALAAAGSITFEDGLRLVRSRGEYMEEAGRRHPGTMASVIGLSKEYYAEISRESGAEIANYNSNEQIVFSGLKNKVERAGKLAEEKGAQKVIFLNVSGAFHSNLMEEARERLRFDLEKITIKSPSVPFIPNVTARFESDPAKIKENLYRQVTSSVQWVGTMEFLYSQGLRSFIEIGPGKVLKGLARKINPDFNVLNLDSLKNIEKVNEFLAENKESPYVA